MSIYDDNCIPEPLFGPSVIVHASNPHGCNQYGHRCGGKKDSSSVSDDRDSLLNEIDEAERELDKMPSRKPKDLEKSRKGRRVLDRANRARQRWNEHLDKSRPSGPKGTDDERNALLDEMDKLEEELRKHPSRKPRDLEKTPQGRDLMKRVQDANRRWREYQG